jgi:hypothetical protein
VLPKYHAFAAAAAAPLLVRLGWRPRAVAAFTAAAVLIDADHYLGYIWKTGDLSLARAYAYYRTRYHVPRSFRFRLRRLLRPNLGVEQGRFLHSAPAIAAVFLVAWRWPALRPVAWGLLFHRLQDEAYGAFLDAPGEAPRAAPSPDAMTNEDSENLRKAQSILTPDQNRIKMV